MVPAQGRAGRQLHLPQESTPTVIIPAAGKARKSYPLPFSLEFFQMGGMQVRSGELPRPKHGMEKLGGSYWRPTGFSNLGRFQISTGLSYYIFDTVLLLRKILSRKTIDLARKSSSCRYPLPVGPALFTPRHSGYPLGSY